MAAPSYGGPEPSVIRIGIVHTHSNSWQCDPVTITITIYKSLTLPLKDVRLCSF